MTARIVVLGGGFAGVRVAQRLAPAVREGRASLEIVDAANYFLYTPMLPEAAAGSIEAAHVVTPLRALVPHATIRQARFDHLSATQRRIHVTHTVTGREEEIDFDHLVIALGSTTEDYGTPGVHEHAIGLKTLGDAFRIRNTVLGCLEAASAEPDAELRRELCTVAIIGGSYTGVELAGSLVDFVHKAVDRFYPQLRDLTAVVLLEMKSRLLYGMPGELGDFAGSHLARRGVDVRTDATVQAVHADRVEYREGDDVRTRCVIWAAGVRASTAIESGIPAKTTSGGRLIVTPNLEVGGLDGVWAGGDCAAVPDLENGGDCPPTAQFANAQGDRLAANVEAVVRGGYARSFRYLSKGQLVSLGERSAAGLVGGRRVSGLPAWLMWRTWYLTKLPTLHRKIRVGADWAVDLAFPPDIAQFPIDVHDPIATPRAGVVGLSFGRKTG